MQRRLPLDVVVGERAIVLERLSREDEALLVGRDALLVLDFALDHVDGVRGLDLERHLLAVQRLDKQLAFPPRSVLAPRLARARPRIRLICVPLPLVAGRNLPLKPFPARVAARADGRERRETLPAGRERELPRLDVPCAKRRRRKNLPEDSRHGGVQFALLQRGNGQRLGESLAGKVLDGRLHGAVGQIGARRAEALDEQRPEIDRLAWRQPQPLGCAFRPVHRRDDDGLGERLARQAADEVRREGPGGHAAACHGATASGPPSLSVCLCACYCLSHPGLCFRLCLCSCLCLCLCSCL